ncbi:MAG: chemotaxis protein CheD, partial [Proteobacteria bacterium]|nr:chemotaxis protein CheD [Pseudomonadota bacterium]
MRIEHPNKKIHVTLSPGDYYVTDQDAVLSTLLGSCISACLYDPVNKVVGMNHFLLSRVGYSKVPLYFTNAGRYGVHAMELVINGMLKLGAKRKYLKAKAFGGGNVLSSEFENGDNFSVGDINVRFIREFLATEKIPLLASDLGG